MSIGSTILDTLIAYKFIKIISTNWKNTEAYKLGIIDDKGKILKKRNSLKTKEEKSAYPSIFYTLCWNLKKLMDRIPIVNTKAGTLVASVMLLREVCGKDISNPALIDELVREELLKRGFSISVISESAAKPQAIPSGVYQIRGRKINISTDILPIDECFGHPVYKADGVFFILSEAKRVKEEAPVNNVGGGAIAGASPGQEPPGPKFAKGLRRLRKKKPPQIPPMDGPSR
jgi:hypothetical protein